jgi:hypothetical protein
VSQLGDAMTFIQVWTGSGGACVKAILALWVLCFHLLYKVHSGIAYVTPVAPSWYPVLVGHLYEGHHAL